MSRKVIKQREKLPVEGDDLKTVHIQARINPRIVRENDAYAVYAHYVNQNKDDRWIVREALIAFGVATGQGWQPQEEVNPVVLSAEAVKAVNRLSRLTPMISDFQKLVTQLLTMDFSQMRYADGSQVDGQDFQQQLSVFDKSATDMLGDATFFEIDE